MVRQILVFHVNLTEIVRLGERVLLDCRHQLTLEVNVTILLERALKKSAIQEHFVQDCFSEIYMENGFTELLLFSHCGSKSNHALT